MITPSEKWRQLLTTKKEETGVYVTDDFKYKMYLTDNDLTIESIEATMSGKPKSIYRGKIDNAESIDFILSKMII